MNTNIAPNLKDILTVIDVLLKQPDQDKQRLRRARAHVESAFYILGGSMSQTAFQSQQTAATQPTALAANAVCICPPGARHRDCPALVHNA